MRLEGGSSTVIHDNEDKNKEYVNKNTVAVEGKKSLKDTRHSKWELHMVLMVDVDADGV